ncbi:MAG: hypothetical protein BWK77_06495 [Verrucomicrobia bacterium A1]|nr:MAG: hypothetical protein BWK77_06495 [Verrucomicrobia bacterium A1]
MNWGPVLTGFGMACIYESAPDDILRLSAGALVLGTLLLAYRLWRERPGRRSAMFDVSRHYSRIAEASGEVFFELDVRSRLLT